MKSEMQINNFIRSSLSSKLLSSFYKSLSSKLLSISSLFYGFMQTYLNKIILWVELSFHLMYSSSFVIDLISTALSVSDAIGSFSMKKVIELKENEQQYNLIISYFWIILFLVSVGTGQFQNL